MEETISLKEIFRTLKKRIALILIITLLAVAASAIVTYFFITPKYDASTQILVNQKNTNDSNIYNTNSVQTNVQLVNTYSVIVNSPTVLNQVNKNLHLGMTSDQLKDLITVNTEQNSQVFTVTAETASPTESAKIANGIADVFKSQVQKVMNVDNVSILSKATVGLHPSPVKPKPLLNIAIALIVGLMVSVGIAFLLEYLDSTIKTEDDIERVLGLPVLGTISKIHDTRNRASKSASAMQHRARSERVEAR